MSIEYDKLREGRNAYLWAWAQTPWVFKPGLIEWPKVPPTDAEIEECYRWLVGDGKGGGDEA